MIFNTVYTVKNEISKDAFLRQLLFNLASDSGTPPDVVDAKFSLVEEGVEEVIVCTAHIEMDYSASIGYAREGTHWTADEQIKSRKEYEEREQRIKATMEWMPYRGHASGDITATAFNGSERSHTDHYVIESVIKSIQSHSIVVQGEADVNDEGREKVLRECRILFKENIRFPGDRKKNIRTNSDITVLDFCCYKLPIYTVEFTYNEKTYFAWGYACGNLRAYCKGPCMADMDETQIEEKTRKYRMVSKAARLLFVGSLFFACIMCFVNTPWWLVMPIASLAMAILSHRKFKDEYYRIWISCFSIETKQDALEETFKARSFDMLTEEERKLFWIEYHTYYAMSEESNQERQEA